MSKKFVVQKLFGLHFASIMIAVIVFAGGQDVYNDPDLHYGLKSVYDGSRYIDNAGWYMDAVQPWSTFLFFLLSLPY